ncbi:MAG: hypothetical protein ACI9G1_002765 [Pirellulaceae bacterium]|jgi:hypothetical protein
MEEIRGEIWDYLYKTGGSKSVNDIAQHLGIDPTTVRAVIDHEWFDTSGEEVAIATVRH